MPQKPFRRRLAVFVSLPLAFLLSVILLTRFDIKGHHEGLFLLKGRDWRPFEFKDDLYLGDGNRLLLHFDTDRIRNLLPMLNRREAGKAYLKYVWDATDGSGYVVNVFPDGKQLMTSFSRFTEDDGKIVHGIFVGGGLPDSVRLDSVNGGNDTGMAWFDGTRWYHVWCNVNEGIGQKSSSGSGISPSGWKFLGSRVLNQSNTRLVLESEHEVVIAGVPLLIRRHAYFTAGEPFFRLGITMTNVGTRPLPFTYSYGDEPWLGDFGRGLGNVGWVRDRLVRHEEILDPHEYSYAGMLDIGNEAAGDPPDLHYTGIANFLAWPGFEHPTAYFANSRFGPNGHTPGIFPLSSNERFIGVQWDFQPLPPGESRMIYLVVGKAETGPRGIPSLPPGALLNYWN